MFLFLFVFYYSWALFDDLNHRHHDCLSGYDTLGRKFSSNPSVLEKVKIFKLEVLLLVDEPSAQTLIEELVTEHHREILKVCFLFHAFCVRL
jgi:hypothetical protein